MQQIDPPTIYKVFTNTDQLKKKASSLEHHFKEQEHNDELLKNRSVAEFTDLKSAAEVYYQLHRLGVSSLRNWIG